MKTSQVHFYSHKMFIVQIGNMGYDSIIIVSSFPDSHLFLYESEKKKNSSYAPTKRSINALKSYRWKNMTSNKYKSYVA